MGKVRIHLDNILGALLQGVPEPSHIGRAQSQFVWPVKDVHPFWVPFGQIVSYLSGSIRRIIVDNQDFQARHTETAQFGHQGWQIVGFVIGGDDHHDLWLVHSHLLAWLFAQLWVASAARGETDRLYYGQGERSTRLRGIDPLLRCVTQQLHNPHVL